MTTPATQATQRHWDALAEGYDRAKARNAVYYGAVMAIIHRSVPVERRGRVLEVGCGTGGILASLSPRAGVGIDLSQRMIEAATSRFAGSPNLSFAVMDAASEAPAGEFDAVVCADVLEHAENWRAVVGAIAGACAMDGIIVIITPNPLWALPLWILETLRLKMPEGPHQFVYRRAIRHELERLDCRIVHCGASLLCPARLLGLGSLISRAALRVPLLRELGVIQCVAAVRGENNYRRDAEAQREDP